MGVAKKLYRATVAKNNNRPTLNNKKSTQRQIKGELRLPFVLSAIPESPDPCGSWLASDCGRTFNIDAG
jgi:hypothetical protein